MPNNHLTISWEPKDSKIHSSSPSAFVQKMRQIDNPSDMVILARPYH